MVHCRVKNSSGVLLPIYLELFLEEHTASLVQIAPFIHTFIWLIVIPFILAVLVQLLARGIRSGKTILT